MAFATYVVRWHLLVVLASGSRIAANLQHAQPIKEILLASLKERCPVPESRHKTLEMNLGRIFGALGQIDADEPGVLTDSLKFLLEQADVAAAAPRSAHDIIQGSRAWFSDRVKSTKLSELLPAPTSELDASWEDIKNRVRGTVEGSLARASEAWKQRGQQLERWVQEQVAPLVSGSGHGGCPDKKHGKTLEELLEFYDKPLLSLLILARLLRQGPQDADVLFEQTIRTIRLLREHVRASEARGAPDFLGCIVIKAYHKVLTKCMDTHPEDPSVCMEGDLNLHDHSSLVSHVNSAASAAQLLGEDLPVLGVNESCIPEEVQDQKSQALGQYGKRLHEMFQKWQ